MTDIERQIATKVIDDALAADYMIQISDEEGTTLKKTTERDVLLVGLHVSDEEYLTLYPPIGHNYRGASWVHLIYGNDGTDLIADYTTNIEWLLAGANKLAEQLAMEQGA